MILDDFTQGYIECMIWAEEPEAGSVTGLTPHALQQAIADCTKFQTDNKWLLEQAYASDVYIQGNKYNANHAGHDFWLTRNGHGAGFWDRGLKTTGDQLTEATKTRFKSVDVYVTDDGLMSIG
jgi:hypothetical protein